MVCNPHEGHFAHSTSCMPQPVQSQGFDTSGHHQPNMTCVCIYTEIQMLAGRGESFSVILEQTLMKPGAPAARLPTAALELLVIMCMRKIVFLGGHLLCNCDTVL